MATLHGKDTEVALYDQDATAAIFSVSGVGACDTAEDHGYVDDKTFKAGLMSGSVDFQGRFVAVSGSDLATLRGTNSGIVASFGGHAVGAAGLAAYGPVTQVAPSAPVGGIVDFSAHIERGGPSFSLHDGSAVAAAANLASIDLAGTGTVGRANGDAIGVLVVTAVTASSFTFKLQHSTNDSTWVDLLDFNGGAAISAVGSYGGAAGLAAGTDLRRYIRGVVGGTGTSITFALAVVPLNA